MTDEDGQTLSQIMGVAPEVLLHEAVESYLGHHQTAHRLAALRQARGIWSQCDEMPALTEFRREWDRP